MLQFSEVRVFGLPQTLIIPQTPTSSVNRAPP